MASQFQHQRLPVVTWKHRDKKVVLLRSSSFVPSSITRKTVSSSALAGIRNPAAAKQAKIAAANAGSGTNPGGIGVYNAEVENYLLQFLLIEKSDKPSTALVHQISMPPETMEFDRVGSLQRGQQLYSADSSDSIDSGVGADTTSADRPHQPQIRGRAATFDVYKIRNRVGSKVAQITKYTQEVLANKPQEKNSKGSPSVKRLLSIKRKGSGSPQPSRRSLVEVARVYEFNGSNPSSPNSVFVTENGDLTKRPKEEVDSGVTPVKNTTPRSADSSPQGSPKLQQSKKIRGHKRAKSSDNIDDLKGIELAEIEMTEKQSSSSQSSLVPVSPIDWEAVGNERTEDKVRT